MMNELKRFIYILIKIINICVSKDNAFSGLELNKVYDRKLAEHIRKRGEDSEQQKTNFHINKDEKSHSNYASSVRSEQNQSDKQNHEKKSDLKKKEILEESDRIEKKNDKVHDKMDKRKMNDEMGKQEIQNEGCAISLGNRSSELHYQLSENEINERIKNLGDIPSLQDIYILWWQVRGDQRRNFLVIGYYLEKLFKSLMKTHKFDQRFLKKEWNKWYHGLLNDLIAMETKDNKNFYSLLKKESWTREKFEDFIDTNILEWKNHKINTRKKWESTLTEDFNKKKNDL